MVAVRRRQINTYNLRRKTEALERAAGEIGDHFLQSLYAMARCHLEERVRDRRGLGGEPPTAEDPMIACLAAKLIASAHADGH